MTDPRPLTDDHLAALKDGHACLACPECAVLRLIVTVEQVRRERDAIRLRFAALVEGVLSFAEAETNAIVAAGLRAMVDDDDIRDYRAVVALVHDAARIPQLEAEQRVLWDFVEAHDTVEDLIVSFGGDRDQFNVEVMRLRDARARLSDRHRGSPRHPAPPPTDELQCRSMENGTPLTCEFPAGHDGSHSFDSLSRLHADPRYPKIRDSLANTLSSALRPDTEPLTDNELYALERDSIRLIGASVSDTRRLIATVEQARRERDGAREALEVTSTKCRESIDRVVAERDAARAENKRLRHELDEAQLRSIEARNPGIDMEQVDAFRRAQTTTEETSEPETCPRWVGPEEFGKESVCGLPRPCPVHGLVPGAETGDGDE